MALLLLLSRSVVSNSLQPHGLQHARLPCPSPTPGAYSNLCPPRCLHLPYSRIIELTESLKLMFSIKFEQVLVIIYSDFFLPFYSCFSKNPTTSMLESLLFFPLQVSEIIHLSLFFCFSVL